MDSPGRSERQLGVLLDHLRAPPNVANEGARVQAASDLSRLGLRLRHSSAPRGTLWVVAGPTVDLERALVADIVAHLRRVLEGDTESAALRAEVALALGEWGDAGAIAMLRAIALDTNADAELQQAAVVALGNLGGLDATACLEELVTTSARAGQQDRLYGALGALAGLAHATPLPGDRPAVAVVTRGSAALPTLTDVLGELSVSQTQRPDVRQLANEVLELALAVGF